MCRAAILFSLAVGVSHWGCASISVDKSRQSESPTPIQYRVFEVAERDANRVIPDVSRRQVEGSPYLIALVPKEQLDTLAHQMREDSGSLVNRTRSISDWPRIADSWAYSRAGVDKVFGGGAAAGFLGVCQQDSLRRVRIDYHVIHQVDQAGAAKLAVNINARIFYEGNLSKDQAVVFLAPITRKDGLKLVHVIAFEIGESE